MKLPTWFRRTFLAGLAFTFVTISLAAALVLWPLWAPHVLKLGRIHKGIAIGDPADPIWSEIERYCKRRQRAGAEVYFSRGPYQSPENSTWKCSDGSDPAGYLHAYEWVWMDDVQLHVLLDAGDNVCGTVFWAD